jgi:hypothetical protein
MAALRTVNLFLAFIASMAPLAHVLELPSKLMLDGPLWLAIQQHLYRGWGTLFGPVEIAALFLSGVLLISKWRCCVRLLRGHDRRLFPFQRPGERGFERLDGNYVAGRLGCISAPVGGRPRACGRPVRDSVRQPIAAVGSEPRGMTNVSLRQ